jgi:hypothetical protein
MSLTSADKMGSESRLNVNRTNLDHRRKGGTSGLPSSAGVCSFNVKAFAEEVARDTGTSQEVGRRD